MKLPITPPENSYSEKPAAPAVDELTGLSLIGFISATITWFLIFGYAFSIMI